MIIGLLFMRFYRDRGSAILRILKNGDFSDIGEYGI
jgi:hypothetical protein